MITYNFSFLEAKSGCLVNISMTNHSNARHVLSRAKSIHSFLSFYEFLEYFYYCYRYNSNNIIGHDSYMISYCLVTSCTFSWTYQCQRTPKVLIPPPWLTMFTYPMKHSCILRKYISRPLLMSRSGPCCHIGSEMYLQPSRPRMHANSASRENSRFLPQVLASF